MISFILRLSQGYRKQILLLCLFAILQIAFSLSTIWCSKLLIDRATSGAGAPLAPLAVLIVFFLLLQILISLLSIRLKQLSTAQLSNQLRHQVFTKLVYSRWPLPAELHSGDIMTRLIRDADELVGLLIHSLPLAFSSLLQFIAAVVFMYILSPMLALTLAILSPPIVFFSKLYYQRMRKHSLQIKKHESEIGSSMEESLQNPVVIRTFERQGIELHRLSRLQEYLRQAVYKRMQLSVFTNGVLRIAFGGGYVLAFIWSAYELAARRMSFGTLTAYLQLVGQMQRPLLNLLGILPKAIAAKTAAERLEELYLLEQEKQKAPLPVLSAPTLVVKDLFYAYPDTATPILIKFSLCCKPGEAVAITGETGVGKTTLFRILMGLMPACSGELYLKQGQRKLKISEASRRNFALVPQTPSLFSGSLLENLLVGRPDATEEEVRHCLHIAVADFIFERPEGLEIQLGEHGRTGLSEGQAQRIAIARALLRPSKILLMDEPTSALDAATEELLFSRIREHCQDHCLLIITHSQRLAALCDRCVQL